MSLCFKENQSLKKGEIQGLCFTGIGIRNVIITWYEERVPL